MHINSKRMAFQAYGLVIGAITPFLQWARPMGTEPEVVETLSTPMHAASGSLYKNLTRIPPNPNREFFFWAPSCPQFTPRKFNREMPV